ncbi:MAG: hypothetical protein IPL61_01625 [Myxococcales bacterium]|nr:hypothetical protein [Myxococcales bacterium]
MSNCPRFRRAFIASTLLALTGVATADDAAVPEAAPVRFTTLAPDGARSEINAEFSVTIPDDDAADQNLYGGHLDAQLVGAQGVGGYARMGFASLDDVQALTNLELGGLYRIKQRSSAVTFRGGLIVPTGPDASDGFDALVPIISELARRPSDLALAAVDSTLLRLSVSPSYHDGGFYARADVGLDVFVDAEDRDNPDPLYHVDLAAGFQQGHGAATVELTTIGTTDSDDDDKYHALALGGQYDLGGVTADVALVLPFTSGGDDIDAKTLVFGLSAAL